MSSFRDYMEAQVHEIEIHKWIESEKAGKDLGKSAIESWIRYHAKAFRDSWDKLSKG